MILDGGPTSVGLESTVVDVTGDEAVILRVGGVSREAIARALGVSTVARAEGEPGKPSSPGMLARHYAPAAQTADQRARGESGRGVAGLRRQRLPEHSGPMVNLSPSGDLVEAAANLFAALRALDSSGVAAIAVMPIPNESLGEAINDRLRRGAK